jgi:hypothetical protein
MIASVDNGKDPGQKLTVLCMSRIFLSFWHALFTKLQLGEQQKRAHTTAVFQYVRELPEEGVL